MRHRRMVMLVALFAFCCTSARTPEPVPEPLPFAFQSNFWVNLHHFIRAAGRGMPIAAKLTDEERAIWDAGVEFYRTHYSQKDLVRDESLITVKDALRSATGTSLEAASIDAETRSVLQRVAPIYRKYWWARHDAANRRWIEQANPLVVAHGAALIHQVPAALNATWPQTPVPVDLSIEAGPNAAYTTEGPHATISSVEPTMQGLASLEMLFHEPSHAWGAQLFNGVARAARSENKKVPRQLWHAVLFYNAGELTRRRLAASGIEYVEYAQKHDVYKQLCGDGCRDRVKQAWDRRLSGELTVQQALEALVTSSPAEP